MVKATFSELTFEKSGMYTYKITEVVGWINYDGMECYTVTVKTKTINMN